MCICRQGWVDVRHKVGITRRQKQTRGLVTHGEVVALSNQRYHLHNQGACTCEPGTHSVGPTAKMMEMESHDEAGSALKKKKTAD